MPIRSASRVAATGARKAWQPPALGAIRVEDACGYALAKAKPKGPQPPGVRPGSTVTVDLELAGGGPRPPIGVVARSHPLVIGPRPESDVRLKECVTRIGTTAHDLPLYSFRYKHRDGLYQGVMAQDVLKVMPAAVVAGPDGFYRVDYEMLGVEFKRLN